MRKIVMIAFVLIASNHCCYSQVDSLAIVDSFKIDSIKFIQSFTQINGTNLIFGKEYYIQKSISFKKTGNTLLVTGSSLMLGGVIIATDKNIDIGKAVVALGVMVVGALVDLISIPFFISSNHNANLAKSLP